jgi:hypothetical protein
MEPHDEIEPADAGDEVEGDSEASVGEATTDGPPKKKRTRRGTRGGGRSRAKPTPAGGAADPPASGDVAKPTPKIHLPSTDLGVVDTDAGVGQQEPSQDGAGELVPADGQPKKRKTRRGTRGGRKRRKPAANGGPEGAALAENGSGDPEVELVAAGEQSAADPSPTAADRRDPGSTDGATKEPVVEPTEELPEEYVPMSEWIDDFDARKPARPRAPKA